MSSKVFVIEHDFVLDGIGLVPSNEEKDIEDDR